MGIVARQGVFNAISIIIGFAIGAFNNLVVLKWFEEQGEPAEYYGLINLILSWSIVLSQVLAFGAGSIIVRFGPKLKEQGGNNALYYFAWIYPGIGLILFSIYLFFLGDSFIALITKDAMLSNAFIALFLLLLLIPQTFFRGLSAIAISNFETNFVAFLNEIAIRLLILLSVALYFLNWISIIQLFYAFILSYLIQFFIMWFYLGHFKTFKISAPEKALKKDTITYGLFSVLDNGASMLYNRIDVLMIGAMIGFNEVNYYNFAFFAATVISLPGRALVSISSSIVSDSFHRNDWKNIQSLYTKSALNQLIGGGFIFICLYAGMDSLIDYMPPEFADAKYVFLYLGISKLFDMITSINGLIIQITPHYKFNFYFNSVLVGLVILSNLILIPYYGIIGAAIATAFCVLINNLLKTLFLYWKYQVQPFSKPMLASVICLAIPFVIGYLLPNVFDTAFMNFLFKASVTGCIALPIIWLAQLSEEIDAIASRILKMLRLK